MHTKALTFSPRKQWCAAYFRDSEFAPWLCRRYLKIHVELPEGCKKIRLVSVANEPLDRWPDYWDIKQDGRITGVRTELANSLQRWNQINWENGDRYIYIDYEETTP